MIQYTYFKLMDRFQLLLISLCRISPSAKRAIPVISKLSPDKESEKSQEVNVATAVGEAAVILMATPLLIDRVVSTQNLNRKGSWVRKQICESQNRLSISKSMTVITIQMTFINKRNSRHTILCKRLFGFHPYNHLL